MTFPTLRVASFLALGGLCLGTGLVGGEVSLGSAQATTSAPADLLPAPQTPITPATIAPAPEATPQRYVDPQVYRRPERITFTERSRGCATVVQGNGMRNDCGGVQPAVRVRQSKPAPVPIAAPRFQRRSQIAYAPPRVDRQRRSVTVQTPPAYIQASRYYQPSPLVGKKSFIFPLAIPTSISSVFGWRIHPITGSQRFHTGTDLAAPQGTPVVAAARGRVEVADYVGGYGLMVSLRHADNRQESRYAHLSAIYVQPGTWVEQGTILGLVGSTGFSTGPHLHFEWRYRTANGWVPVDAGTSLEAAMAQLIQTIAQK